MFFFIISTTESKEDEVFLTELYEKYYPIMKRKAFEISHDYNIVDDLIQEAFVRLIDKVQTLKSLEPRKQVSYLVQTVQNITLNYIKQRKRKTDRTVLNTKDDGVEWIVDDQPSLEEMYNLKEEYRQIGLAIRGLSERDRLLLYNKYILELSDKEIAVTLGIQTANVRSYLTRARRRAMKLLLKKGPEAANEITYG
ncbi:RNA polymerase sigma factor [Paenibacillus jiagnxiensis]|uniref:RNA polymerase sigma factor n=1 Tax=Paenibacillus jiagnxiensis TaxID=3228926 RepID=UPI0033A87716